MDKECNIGAPCAYCNRHSNSVPIPDGNSAKPPSYMSALFVGEDLRREKDRELTYVRSTIRVDAAERATYANIYRQVLGHCSFSERDGSRIQR